MQPSNMLPQVPDEAVCNTCGCRISDARHQFCAGCEAMIDLGDANARCPRSDSTLLYRIRSILHSYWQRVGVPRPEPGIAAPRPGDRVVIAGGRETRVPDPPSPSGEEGGGGGASGGDFHFETTSRQEIPARLLSSWMPLGKAIDEGPLHATVTVAVEFEGSLIRLQAQHIFTPDALRMGATSMIDVILRMMREHEVGHAPR